MVNVELNGVVPSQQAFTCSESTIEPLEGVKYAQS